MKKYLEKIGSNAKIAFEKKISNKKKNKVLNYYTQLIIRKVSIPIGIIGVIYESRPNVTSDVSTLCFKSGNCVILRGGSEAYFSNKILAELFRKSLEKNKIDKNFVKFIEIKNRKLVDYMLSKMSKFIDVIFQEVERVL